MLKLATHHFSDRVDDVIMLSVHVIHSLLQHLLTFSPFCPPRFSPRASLSSFLSHIDYPSRGLAPSWRTLAQPALMPLSVGTAVDPTISDAFYMYNYSIALESSPHKNKVACVREMLYQRQSQQYQIVQSGTCPRVHLADIPSTRVSCDFLIACAAYFIPFSFLYSILFLQKRCKTVRVAHYTRSA